jgi:hypothetical protein
MTACGLWGPCRTSACRASPTWCRSSRTSDIPVRPGQELRCSTRTPTTSHGRGCRRGSDPGSAQIRTGTDLGTTPVS